MNITQPDNGREQYQVPKDFALRLAKAGGLNPYGQPNWRVVWGWSRLEYAYGKWEGEKDRNGNLLPAWTGARMVPKYPWSDLNKWILETWIPPHKYGEPEYWPAELGPYPSRGDYEHVKTLRDVDGGFIRLSLDVCDQVIRLVERSKHATHGERKTAIMAKEDKKEKDWDTDADAILSDHPYQHMRPHIIVPRNYIGTK